MVLVNNFEVLDMAVNLERNGISFYSKAAQQAADPSLAKLLSGLVEMERAHERTFSELRAHLSPEQRQIELADKEGVSAAYIDSLLHGQVVFDPGFDAQSWLEAHPTPAEMLRKAVGFEKDTVMFYMSIRELMLPVQASTAKIDTIIAEEKRHVVLLAGQLRRYVS
jgi:rubrerythrin